MTAGILLNWHVLVAFDFFLHRCDFDTSFRDNFFVVFYSLLNCVILSPDDFPRNILDHLPLFVFYHFLFDWNSFDDLTVFEVHNLALIREIADSTLGWMREVYLQALMVGKLRIWPGKEMVGRKMKSRGGGRLFGLGAIGVGAAFLLAPAQSFQGSCTVEQCLYQADIQQFVGDKVQSHNRWQRWTLQSWPFVLESWACSHFGVIVVGFEDSRVSLERQIRFCSCIIQQLRAAVFWFYRLQNVLA